jgi:predicted DNA-binding protein
MSIKATTSLRLPKDLAERVDQRAEREKRKVANMVAYMVEQALEMDVNSDLYQRMKNKAEQKKVKVSDLINFYLNNGLKEH